MKFMKEFPGEGQYGRYFFQREHLPHSGVPVIMVVGIAAVLFGLFGVGSAMAQTPTYSVARSCPQEVSSNRHTISYTNNTATQVNFDVLFVSPGGATQQLIVQVGANSTLDVTYGSGSLSAFPEDNTVGVTVGGQAVQGGNFVFDCSDVPPTTTTTQPTTTTTQPATTTTTEPVTTTTQPVTTTTTMPATSTTTARVMATTTDPTTTTTTPARDVRASIGETIVRGAATGQTLPRTGSDYRGLVLLGLALTTLGTAMVWSARRRARG